MAPPFGLLALGKIGRCVAAQLRQTDVHVIAYDPYVQPAAAAELGVRLCSIEEVFTTADVVSCHLPLHAATMSLITRTNVRQMKNSALSQVLLQSASDISVH